MDSKFPKSLQTFYNYIHKGYFPSLHDEMLSRSFSYKVKVKKDKIKTITKNNIIKKVEIIMTLKSILKNIPLPVL